MSVKTHWFLLALVSFALSACGGSGGSSSPASSSAMNSSVSSAMSLSSEAGNSSSEAEVSSSSEASVSSEGASSISSEASSVSSVEASSSSSSTPDITTEVGVFVDSAVIGISYTTSPGGLTGVTNEDGEYNFEEGDTVVFSIGDLDLPAVTAKGIVTPLDLAGTDDINNPTVVNIARLLQSLDADGDPSNGITIPAAAAAVAAQVDFSLAVEAFAASEAVANLVANSGSVTTTIISQEDALDHLADSIEDQRGDLIGTWVYQDTTDPDPDRQFHIALIFLDEDHYVIVNDEDGVNDDAGMDGFEFGTYTWNLRTGVAEFTVITDTNGEWGFSHPCDDSEVITLEIRSGELLLQAEGEVGEFCDEASDDAPPIRLERIRSAPDEIYGSWQVGGPSYDEFFVFTLTPNGTYFVAEDKEFDPGDSTGEPGIERGTFTYDEETGVVLFTTLTDTNGQWGFSHSCAALDVVGTNNLACGPEGRDIVETLMPDGDNLIFVSEVDTILNDGVEEPVALDRVANYEGDLPMPTDATGTWTIDVVEDATACGAEGPESHTDVFTVVQEGSELTVTDEFGTYQGYVNGYELNWSGNYTDEDGSGTLNVNAIFFYEEDDLKISGSSSWTFIAADDPEFTCDGSSEFDGLLTAP